MIRIQTAGINCPICLKDDWCLISEDGTQAICARIQEGSVRAAGEAGWVHNLTEETKPKQTQKRSYPVNWDGVNKIYQENYRKSSTLFGSHSSLLADEWNIKPEILTRFGIGWDDEAYTFPIINEHKKIVGIHKRFIGGSKRMAKGSKTGIFVPTGITGERNMTVHVCEGISDTAVALELGFNAIGRLNCNSGTMILRRALRRVFVVIVADNDEVGVEGAGKLQQAIRKNVLKSVTIKPLYGKDLREFRKIKCNDECVKKHYTVEWEKI
jgi:phage/plasmid primase-like uncharacterized protein